jgi:alkylated DNA nucleotide flippase Atl1
VVAIAASAVVFPVVAHAGFDVFDLVSGVIESPQFKGKDPIDKLRLAATLLRNKQIRQSDMSFIVLDWGDQYLREPADPLDRLKRWVILSTDEQLNYLRIPRDFLNRTLLAEYLVRQPAYRHASPQKRLEIIGELAEKKLVDWSVSLSYARLYAGGIVTGAKAYEVIKPFDSLVMLKNLKDRGLVGWHYEVPTEALLATEALAMDADYAKASPYGQLAKLADWEQRGLITAMTKKEFEKLPAWRLLVADPSFLKADPAMKRERLTKLKSEGIISAATCSDLNGIFRPVPLASPLETRPVPLPEKISPPGK